MTRDGLDSVLEESRNVDEETDHEDGYDRPASGAQVVHQRFEVERARHGQVTSYGHRDRQPGARQNERVDDGAAVQPVDEVERPTHVHDAIVQEESVRKQRRAEDQIGHGKSFHAGMNGTYRAVANYRQPSTRQHQQSQQVTNDPDHADNWNHRGGRGSCDVTRRLATNHVVQEATSEGFRPPTTQTQRSVRKLSTVPVQQTAH